MSWQFSQDNQFMYMGANYYELLSGPKLINKAFYKSRLDILLKMNNSLANGHPITPNWTFPDQVISGYN